MTPRQVADIVFHPRDKDGEVRFPDRAVVKTDGQPVREAPTLQSTLRGLDILLGMRLISPAVYEEKKRDAYAKYGPPLQAASPPRADS